MRRLSPIAWFAVLLMLSVGFALGLPPSSDALRSLHVSVEEYRLGILTLVVPYAIIWFSAFYGYDKLARYAKTVRETREGGAFHYIATGTGILAWGLALPTLLAIILGGVSARYPHFTPVRSVVDEYIALLAPLIGFWTVGAGTRQLTDLVHTRPTRAGSLLFGLIMILIAIYFEHAVVRNHYTGGRPYYLPLQLLLITIVAAYVYSWYIGLLAAYELWLYAIKARGVLYRRVLSQLAAGIAVIIIGSICTQYIGASFASKGAVASFLSTLVILYGLLIIQAVGYVLVAISAGRLKRIEEV